MTDQELLNRITTCRSVLAGKPVIRGTRLSVEFVVNLLAHGASNSEITQEYTSLSEDDIQACLLFAAKSLSATSFMPLAVELS